MPSRIDEEGAHLDEAVAAEKFVRSRCCGRIEYLIGPKKADCDAGQKEHGRSCSQTWSVNRLKAAERHDADLDELDAAGEHGLVEFVGDLAGGGREEEEGEDEEGGRP